MFIVCLFVFVVDNNTEHLTFYLLGDYKLNTGTERGNLFTEAKN